MQLAKSAFLGETGLEPTCCSQTEITTASLQFLRTFTHKESEVVYAYSNYSGSLQFNYFKPLTLTEYVYRGQNTCFMFHFSPDKPSVVVVRKLCSNKLQLNADTH